WSVSVRAIPCPLEWQDLVQHLLPIGRLLDFRYPATTAIGNARLGDPVVGNGVRRTDVGRAHDTCDGQYPEFRIHAHFLRAPDHEVAVRQYVGDDSGHVQVQVLRTLDGPVGIGLGLGIDRGGPLARRAEIIPAEVGAEAQGALRGAAAVVLVLQTGAVIDLDLHGQYVPNLQRARVGEQPALPVVPKRKALDRLGRRLRVPVGSDTSGFAAGPHRRQRRFLVDLAKVGGAAAQQADEQNDG